MGTKLQFPFPSLSIAESSHGGTGVAHCPPSPRRERPRMHSSHNRGQHAQIEKAGNQKLLAWLPIAFVMHLQIYMAIGSCQPGPTARHGTVPHGPCLWRARATSTAQGTVRGPFCQAVPPGEPDKFHRTVPAHSLTKYI